MEDNLQGIFQKLNAFQNQLNHYEEQQKSHHTILLQSLDFCHATLISPMQGMMKNLSALNLQHQAPL